MSEDIKTEDNNTESSPLDAASQDEGTSTGKKISSKFKKHKALSIVGIVVVVLVIAGIGAFAWHNTPGFCGTVCHDTMNYYSTSYANDPTTLAYQHGHITGKGADTLRDGVADKNNACLDCHPASTGEQIKEVGMTIDGDYTIDTDGKLVIEDGHYNADKEFCLQCHDYDKVIQATANYNGGKHDGASGTFNPHASHQGDLECGTCHSVHGTSKLYCTSCHNAEVPEGWESMADSQ